MKVEFDQSNYARKTDLKEATGFNTSNFVGKSDLVR